MKLVLHPTEKDIEHIVYEIMMFEGTAHKLMGNVQDQFEKNILLESFAIHSRNLFEFFYTKKKRKDDMVVGDFTIRKHEFILKRTRKRNLENLTKKTNKQVAHLTYSRNNYNVSTKGWDVSKINNYMNKTILAFFDCLEDKQKVWFQHYYKKYNVQPCN